MKLLKKTFALMLSLILVVGMIPGSLMTAHAATDTNVQKIYDAYESLWIFVTDSNGNRTDVMDSDYDNDPVTSGTGWTFNCSANESTVTFDLNLNNANLGNIGLATKANYWNENVFKHVYFNINVTGNCSIGDIDVNMDHSGGGEIKFLGTAYLNINFKDAGSKLETGVIRHYGLTNSYTNVNAAEAATTNNPNILDLDYLVMQSKNFDGTPRVPNFQVYDAVVVASKGGVKNYVFSDLSASPSMYFFESGSSLILDLPTGSTGRYTTNENADDYWKYRGSQKQYGDIDSNKFAALSLGEVTLNNRGGTTEAKVGDEVDLWFDVASVPACLMDYGFEVETTYSLTKGSEVVLSGTSTSADKVTLNGKTYDTAGAYTLSLETKLSFAGKVVDTETGTLSVTVIEGEGSGEGGGEETAEIDLVNVTVAEPEAGKTPAVPVVETENVMLVTSTWKEEGKTEKATTFEAGKTYVLEVLVNPEIDYDFATNPAVKINGKDATVTHSSRTAIMCSYKFAVPEEGGETPPTEYDITVTGGTASANKAVAGTSITLTAEQIDGKVFSHWEVNGATVSDANAKETTFTMGNADVTAEAVYKDCECNCHKGGIEGFFFKFVLFFQKIFGMNTVCGCQMKHNVFGDLW